MAWQTLVHSFLIGSENVGAVIVKGIQALQDNKALTALAAAEPKLVGVIDKLAALIPGIGTAVAIAGIADWTVEHWDLVKQIGAVAHFAPADALNYAPFRDDTGDTGFASRD